MRRAAAILATCVLGGLASVAAPARAAVLPFGFSDSLVAAVGNPTALAFTSDGRMLVTTKGGSVRVVRDGAVVETPALDLSAKLCADSERGLLGIAVDPAFATNQFVYLYYTAENSTGACPTKVSDWPVNRVARFVLGANDAIDPASEVVLFDRIPSVNGNHNAGDLEFGPDGMLYVSVGDSGCDYAAFGNCAGSNDAARDTNVALGKILRISPVDGSAPSDNPFFGTQDPCRDDGFTSAGSQCPETFAWGLRNPFRIAFAPDGRLYANDVGQNAWEEVDDVQAGKDYGWNIREGKCLTGSTSNCPAPPPNLTDPILAYGRADGCRSITGGAFAPGSWPEPYRGDYIFADFVCGKIFRVEGTSRVDFATALGSNSAVHLELGSDDALYYTTFASGGQVRKIAPAAATGEVFLSDLAPASATNGFGPVERDMSNGGSAAGDGNPIRLNGVISARGLGVHAASSVTYALGSDHQSFLSDVGVDDECGNLGSVVFQVFVDGVKRYDSGLMTATTTTKSVAVDVSGGSTLLLKVTNAGDGGSCDHADWANARLTSTTPPTTTTTSSTTTTTSAPPTTTTTTTVPPGGTFLSDLTPTSATNGFGPVERDMSNGGSAAGDGNPIRLNGVISARGLGVHAASTVTYSLGGSYSTFLADVGVDDECGSLGSVVFQVFVDGVKRYDSGLMTASTATKSPSVNVAGATQLTLKVTNAGDGGSCDHADWANARLTSSTTPTTTTTASTTTTTGAPPPTTTTTTSSTTTTTTTTTSSTTTTTSATPTTTTTTTVPPSGTFLSDLTPTSATNGFGPVERDMSNGASAAGDGNPIRLNGVISAKGLGVHATSNITYSLGGSYSTFLADVGVDDECGNLGSVVFQVFVDGVKRFDSAKMTATTDTKSVAVNVSGGSTLLLKVTNAGDGGTCDHADWANARLG